MNAGLCVKGDNDNTKKKKKNQVVQFHFFSWNNGLITICKVKDRGYCLK